ncbi:MAG: chalcone isomerase family protein [Alcaligenaceae bacterium]
MRKLILGLLMMGVFHNASFADQALSGVPDAQLVGRGLFSRFGFSVYEARLFAPLGRYAPEQPFALSLTYSRSIAGERLVQASFDEMQKLQAPLSERKDWRAELERVLPDVVPGDSITAVYQPGQGAVFFHRDRQTGRINNDLAKYFFGIWLDLRTSEPSLRQALLGTQ